MKLIHDVSALTHPNPECQMACGVAAAIASGLISGVDLVTDVARGIRSAVEYYRKNEEFAAVFPKFNRLFDPDFHLLSVYEISSGDSAVETLEAAVWSLLNTNSFEECVLQAVNLGGDTDGIGALAGGFAGIFYTRRKIPAVWLNTVARPDFIERCCDRLYLSLVRSKMRDLAPFLPYLQNATSETICNWPKPETEDEIRARMSGPDYVPEFLAFVKAFYKSNLACLDYMDVIRAKGLVLWTDTTDAAIENADLELALAVLTAYVRSERFRVGLWCDAVDRKIFYNILCRLTSLTEQTGRHDKVDG